MARHLLALAAFLGLALLAFSYVTVPTAPKGLPQESGDTRRSKEERTPKAAKEEDQHLISRRDHQRESPSITAVAFAPDGKRVVAGDDWGRLTLWEIPLAHKVWEAFAPSQKKQRIGEGGIRAIAFSADGRIVLSAHDDGVLRLWDAATGKLLRSTNRVYDKGHIITAAFAFGGQEILAAYSVGAVVSWSATSGKHLRSFDVGYFGNWPKLAFSLDGQYFLAASRDDRVRLWRTADGLLLRSFVLPQGELAGVGLSATGRYILTAEFGKERKEVCTLRLWEVASDRQARACTVKSLVGPYLGLLPDQRQILTGGSGHPLALWDLAKIKVRRLAAVRPAAPGQVVLSPTGRQAVLFDDHEVLLWDLEGDEEVCTLYWDRARPEIFHCLAISPDGRQLVGRRGAKGSYFLWDTTTGKPTAKLPVETVAASLATGGHLTLVGEFDGTLAVWDLEAGKKIRNLEMPKKKPEFGPRFYSVAVSPDGRWAAADDATHCKLWDVSTGKIRRSLEGLEAPRFTPDSKQVVGFSRNSVGIWDAGSGRLLRTIRGEKELQRSVLSPQGRWAVLTFSNKPGEVWDVVTSKRFRLLDQQESEPEKISPGGKVLLCHLQNGGMRLTELVDGKFIREIPPRRLRQGTWVGFTPDDKLVWFEDDGPRFRFYDPVSGQEVKRLGPTKDKR